MVWLHSFASGYPVFLIPFIEKTVHFPLSGLGKACYFLQEKIVGAVSAGDFKPRLAKFSWKD